MNVLSRPLFALLCVAPTLLVGCGNDTIDLDLKLVTQSCDPAEELNPLAGVSLLRFTITGEGIDPVKFQTTELLSSGSLTLPEIPIGKDVNLRVEAMATSNNIISYGETGPMNLLEVEEDFQAAIFLRRAQVFTPGNASDAPSSCTTLGSPRAAHTATRLSDGRVLIAGGFFEDEQGRHYLKSTEIYDPRTGKLSAGPDLQLARAYHTATQIPGTKYTLLAGGEAFSGGNVQALGSAELFDEELGVFNFIVMKSPRTRHAAAIPSTGGLLLLSGGYGIQQSGAALDSTETFDPRLFESKASAGPFAVGPTLPQRRAEHGSIGLGEGVVLLVGGFDGTATVLKTTLLKALPDASYSVVSEGWDVSLPSARLSPLLAALDDSRVLVTGGFAMHPGPSTRADVSNALAADATDVVHIASPGVERITAATLGAKRGHGGIATLSGGRILVGGGASRPADRPVTAASAELLSLDQSDSVRRDEVGSLRAPRYLSRWVTLLDGTVLVTGGFEHTDTGLFFQRSIELFQPTPL